MQRRCQLQSLVSGSVAVYSSLCMRVCISVQAAGLANHTIVGFVAGSHMEAIQHLSQEEVGCVCVCVYLCVCTCAWEPLYATWS
jgi:hypothetical protein